MKRSRPRISDAQAESIAAFSKIQAKEAADAQRIAATRADLQRSFARTMAELRASSRGIQAVEKWLPRLAVVPVSALALALLWLVAYGLWSGDFPSIAKYSKEHVLRATQPIWYWLAAVYHAGAATLFCWLSLHLLKRTGWLRREA